MFLDVKNPNPKSFYNFEVILMTKIQYGPHLFCLKKNMCDNVKESHRCDLCMIPLTEAEIVLMDDIVSGVDKIHPDEKLSLFYTAGYIASKHKEVCGNDDGSFDDVKDLLSTLDRGKLYYPTAHFFDPRTLGICIFF